MSEAMDLVMFAVYGLAVIAVPVFAIWFALRFLRALERSALARERIARALEEEVKLRAEDRAFGAAARTPEI